MVAELHHSCPAANAIRILARRPVGAHWQGRVDSREETGAGRGLARGKSTVWPRRTLTRTGVQAHTRSCDCRTWTFGDVGGGDASNLPCAHRPRFVQKPSFRRALLERRSLTRERSHATSRALRILCATVSATRASFRHLAPTRVTRRGTLLRSHDAPAVTRPPPRLESRIAPRASRAQRMHSPIQSPLDGLWFAWIFPARLAKLLAPCTRYLSCQCRKHIRSSSWPTRGLRAAARRCSTAAPALVQNCL